MNTFVNINDYFHHSLGDTMSKQIKLCMDCKQQTDTMNARVSTRYYNYDRKVLGMFLGWVCDDCLPVVDEIDYD